MNTDNKYLKTLLAGVLTTALSLGLTGTAFAQGAGGVEPGAGCAAAIPGAIFTPIYGPPFSATATILPVEGDKVSFSVANNQANRLDGGFYITIEPNQIADISFDDLGRRDLQGFCVKDAFSIQFATDFAEVLAVQQFSKNSESATAKVLLLPLQCSGCEQ